MRIGILGIGDIAKKAYLPVLSQRADVELVLCTRNPNTLSEVAAKYHIKDTTTDIETFLNMNLDCVYLTSSTGSHYELAKKVLQAGIALHIDKPMTFHWANTLELVEYANEYTIPFMVGFNRRFTPSVQSVIAKGKPNLIMYQKNRILESDDPRRMIVEDFIHVIDTTKFLLGAEIERIHVSGSKTIEGRMNHVVVQFETAVNRAVCISNYLNGGNEEIIDVHFDYEKVSIHNFSDVITLKNDVTSKVKLSDWIPTLQKRGFETMIDGTINALKNGDALPIPIEDSLETHRIAEIIVKQLEEL